MLIAVNIGESPHPCQLHEKNEPQHEIRRDFKFLNTA